MRKVVLTLGAVGAGCLLVAWSGAAPFLIHPVLLLVGIGLIGGGVVVTFYSGLWNVWKREPVRQWPILAIVVGVGFGFELILLVLSHNSLLWQTSFTVSRALMEARAMELRAAGVGIQREREWIGVYRISHIEYGDEGWEFMADTGPIGIKRAGYVWVTNRARLRRDTYYLHVSGDWYAFER